MERLPGIRRGKITLSGRIKRPTSRLDTTDAQKARQPGRGRCVTWPSMMKALLIFAHYAEVILHMHNYAGKLPRSDGLCDVYLGRIGKSNHAIYLY